MLSRPTGKLVTTVNHTSALRRGLWSDLTTFVLRRPAEQTHIDLSMPGKREIYERRILERLGISVADHQVLNIHKIGIRAAPDFVWNEWARRNPDGHYWPRSIALPAWQDESAEHGKLLLFGLGFSPVFRVDLVRRYEVPLATDPDNARYALYRCSGGYPVGIFAVYIRSRIAAEHEVEPTQMFFLVSFDFFGKKHWLGTHAVRPIWESIHNRVTTHVLNRFKAHCEETLPKTVSPPLNA